MATSRSEVSLQTTRTNTIQYGNRIYSTLTDTPVNGGCCTCQGDWLTLPSDWVIAPATGDSISAIKNNGWSTHIMVFGSGSGTVYATTNYGTIYDGINCCLLQSGLQYKPPECFKQILIMT